MAADEDIRSHCLDVEDIAGMIGDRWHQNTVPGAGSPLPFVWSRRSKVDYGGTLDVSLEPWKTWFELECVADDLDQAIVLGDLVRVALHGARGQVGSGRYGSVRVMDHYDEYYPRNLEADEHLHVVSLIVEVEHA